jgi:hypothetical protein
MFNYFGLRLIHIISLIIMGVFSYGQAENELKNNRQHSGNLLVITPGLHFEAGAGKIFSSYDPGVGFETGINLFLKGGNLFLLSVTRNGIKPAHPDMYKSNSSFTVLEQKNSFSSTGLTAGFGTWKYLQNESGRIKYIYGYFGAGIIRYTRDNKSITQNNATLIVTDSHVHNTKDRYHLTGEINYVLPAGSSLGLDMGFRYSFLLADDSDKYNNSKFAHLFDIKLNLFVPVDF